VITAFNTSGNAYLIFPLTRGHFTVDTSDFEPSVNHAAVGAFHDFSSKRIGRANTTIVLALRIRVAVFRPTIRTGVKTTILFRNEEFLFKSEPGIMFLGLFHNLLDNMSEIESGGGYLIMNVGLTKNQYSIAVLSERIFDHTHRL
jgi:hypothetical protein